MIKDIKRDVIDFNDKTIMAVPSLHLDSNTKATLALLGLSKKLKKVTME